ncbi:MAG TPA: DUF4340 domain-containing protein, partial [Bacteroidales bacterium]|nr:DUF4340 domain-containing protein [Bacteroidales bacterium]HNS47408.1 DUF4340 domain-containing protein [Bacteroidales bacterium]
MKKNLIYGILIVILAIVAILLIVSSSRTTTRQKAASFAISDTASVTRIFLSDKENRNVLLERQPNGGWKLNGKYKAQKESVDLLLKTMLNLAVLEPVSEAAHNTVVRLLSANSVKVEIYQWVPRIMLFKKIRLLMHEKKVRTYYVGHVTQSNIGTYMLMEGSKTPFIVYMPGFRGFVQSRYRTIENDWRDHSIFAVPLKDIASVTVEFPAKPINSFRVVREGDLSLRLYGEHSREEIRSFDTIRALDFLTSFMNIRFEALVNDMNPQRKDTVFSVPPLHILTVTLNDGSQQVVKTYRKPGMPGEIDLEGNPVIFDRDRLYAVFNEGNDTALIQFFVFDRITRPLPYYLNK